MSEWLVDTNVLLDVIGADSIFGERSLHTLTRLSEKGLLIINPIIYAEVGAMMDNIEELDDVLPPSIFHRDPLPWEACFLAGQTFQEYRRCGGTKSRMLADFLIGAHAVVANLGLVSRDRGYQQYFNNLTIIDPNEPG